MISAIEVKRACNELLRKTFPDLPVYGTDTTEGYTRPCFVTRIEYSATPESARLGSRQYLFVADLLEETHDEAFCLAASDKIIEAVSPAVRYSDHGRIAVESINVTFEGENLDIMEMSIQFKPVSFVRRYEDDAEKMETLSTEYKEA